VLALDPSGPLQVDVVAFEEAAVAALGSRDPGAYEAAVQLYTGELLPEDRYETWVEDRRTSLRRRYLALLVDLAEIYEEYGEFELATKMLEDVVSSESTHERAHFDLMRLYTRSGQRLEALRQYKKLQEALSRNLGNKPAEASHQLYEEIRAGRSPLSQPLLVNHASEKYPTDTQHNLPAARTRCIEREGELGELKQVLATTRLLTLTGVCGSGKTRLALEVAKNLVGAYPDGVWLTELATLSEAALVHQALATALGVREQTGRPLIATVVDALRNKQVLLVLDNCEHLIDPVAHLVDILLRSCPYLQVLATSRQALGILGEVKWPVLPLSLPDPLRPPSLKNLAAVESVRLFVERARYHNPAFALSVENAGVVTDICRQLDGIPLGIELAAARLGVLSVEQIAARLKNSLALLTGGDRTVPSRQRTLHGALNWSYELLSKPERRLFERLSIFVGGWTLEAGEAVGTGDGIDRDNVLDLLCRLVDKSLVMAEADAEGEPRYRMLEPIRRYGQVRAEASGEAAPARRRYAALFLELVETAESELRGARQQEWLERLEREHDNLRAILSWALEGEDAELALRLSGPLGEFWHLRGHLSEGRGWLKAALVQGCALAMPARAKALAQAGCIAWEQGDYERSITFSKEGLAMSRKLGDIVGTTAALTNLAWAALYRNEPRRASKLAEEAMMLQRASGDTGGVARSLLILGMVASVQRDYERASALHEESLSLAREGKDNFAIVLSLILGAFVSLNHRYYERAENLCAEGLGLSQRLGMRQLIATHLHISAALAASQGQLLTSARLWGAAEALHEALGTVISLVERYVYEPYIVALHAELEQAALRAAWAEGRAMTLKEAIEYALSKEEGAPLSVPTPEKASAGEPLVNLTSREWHVAFQIARGLTNRQIAEELVISEHTVATYVSRIHKKMGFTSRVQIAASVMEHQLLLVDRG